MARKHIRNGSKFPLDVKAAALAEMVSNPTRSRATIAVERNISVATLHTWASSAALPTTGKQHPNTAAGLKRHWAAQAAIKAYNTATPRMDNGIQVVDYQGKTYR